MKIILSGWQRQEHVVFQPIVISAALLLSCWAAFHSTPLPHTLFITTISATAVFVCVTIRQHIGQGSLSNISPPLSVDRRIKCWTSGALLGLGHLSYRAAGSRDSLSWIQTLTPLAVLFTLIAVQSRPWRSSHSNQLSIQYLALAAVTSAVMLPSSFCSITQTTLGMFFVLASSLAYAQLENLLGPDQSGTELSILDEKQAFPSVNEDLDPVVRDVALGLGTVCLLGTYLFEPTRSINWESMAVWGQMAVATSSVASIMILTILTIRSTGAMRTSLMPSAAVILAHMTSRTHTVDTIFGAVSLLSTACSSTGLLSAMGLEPPKIARLRRLVIVGAILCFSCLAITSSIDQQTRALQSFTGAVNTMMLQSDVAWQPMELTDKTIHPIEYLTGIAQEQHARILQSQSSSLVEATTAYKIRYGLPPPPLFDKWYEYAKARNIDMIDEFNIVHDAMLPFWALKPVTLRARVTEALGYEENGLIALIIRNGKVHKVEGGEIWQRDSLEELVASFVHLLPDLDIAFNQHDEPRIVVPHDELSRMISYAKDVALPASSSRTSHHNEFSSSPQDMSKTGLIPESKVSRFNEYSHQNTWIPSRLSCSPDSPARDFKNVDESSPVADNTTSYALTGLGFVYNLSASTDVCTSPSFKASHGFFDRPNAFKVAHELIPIFSESKVSSFQDILFPSMWHWNRKLPVDRTANMHEPGMSIDMYKPTDNKLSWEQKNNSMWWRGSTTGGYSKNGAWRHHHRQRLVRAINAPDRVKVLLPLGSMSPGGPHTSPVAAEARVENGTTPAWLSTTVPHASMASRFDIAFSGVGQCSPADCHAQEEFFNIAPHVPMADSWRYRHLLDMDGNAFSARFYALLQSGGLVHKMQVFREWHDEWIRPWVHYVPLSLAGGEWAEGMRFLSHEDGGAGARGERIARGIAERGKEWADAGGGRREAMETWMFRLLLEYARVVDDRREQIGYDG